MTTTAQPVPVSADSKEGPNKVLLVILGVLVAAALFMFVIKPMLFSSKPASSGTATTTTQASKSGSGATATTAAGGAQTNSATSGAGASSEAEALTGSGDSGAPGVSSTPVQSDALPQIPAQYAGQQARDPFKPLVQESTAAATSN